MKIDFGTLAFGYKIKVGGGTPNWATSLGQGREYKINNDSSINELLKGMVYNAIDTSKVSCKIGKGGRMVSGNTEGTPIIMGALFKKVYINDILINNGKYILLITRDDSKSHAGRLRFKYGPSNTYTDGTEVYSNDEFFDCAKKQLGLSEDACWFVYDISVDNQDKLILNAIVVNSQETVEYENSVEHHLAWESLIEEREPHNDIEKRAEYAVDKDYEIIEWFRSKGAELADFDERVAPFYKAFQDKYSPEKLASLSGKEILTTIFLNPYNKTNMCYEMEFDRNIGHYFGSIKSGNSYKYGLHYSKKYKSWATGTAPNPIFLDEEEAINIGTEIRDALVNGAFVLEEYKSLDSLEDFDEVYEKLVEATSGYIKRIWFMKYYHIIFPNLFPPIYSEAAQTKALTKIGVVAEKTPFGRLGQLEMFVKKCGISNAVFNHIMWFYALSEEIPEEDIEKDMKTCMEIIREPRTNKIHPINVIVYGAPGTGKTYSMVEYALAIIDNVTLETFIKKHPDHKANIIRYKELVKSKQIVFTTFHQNYGYEEFIQGLRPDKDSESMTFKVVDGVFKTIADEAINDTEGKNYVIIIDEINRANISKVFGELITLIEEDKRWGELNEMSATLQSGEQFAVPNNLYIVGTMNSADKSISLIDAALRRRFEFIEQKPDYNLVSDPVLKKMIKNINLSLVEELDSTDLLVGHSYFINKTEKDLCNILNNNIIPLLYEYFYDNRKKIASLLNNAIKDSGARIEIIDEKVGRLRVKEV